MLFWETLEPVIHVDVNLLKPSAQTPLPINLIPSLAPAYPDWYPIDPT